MGFLRVFWCIVSTCFRPENLGRRVGGWLTTQGTAGSSRGVGGWVAYNPGLRGKQHAAAGTQGGKPFRRGVLALYW